MSSTRPTGPPAGRVPSGGAAPSGDAAAPGHDVQSGRDVLSRRDRRSGGGVPRDARERARGRSPDDVRGLGLRLAAAAGAAAVAVGGWLALQPSQFAAADAGVVPGSSPTPAGAEGAGSAGVPGAASTAGGSEGTSPAAPPAGDPGEAPATTVPSNASPAPAAVPVRLEVDGRAAPVEVVPVGVEPTGALVVPDDPDVLGWWQSGPGVGAPAGSTVLVGHLDVPGDLGVMRALAVLPVDTPVTLVDEQGAMATYRVAARRTFSKDDGLPTDLFRSDGSPQLVLVTCGGAFDSSTGHYADNVVVYAVPA